MRYRVSQKLFYSDSRGSFLSKINPRQQFWKMFKSSCFFSHTMKRSRCWCSGFLISCHWIHFPSQFSFHLVLSFWTHGEYYWANFRSKITSPNYLPLKCRTSFVSIARVYFRPFLLPSHGNKSSILNWVLKLNLAHFFNPNTPNVSFN